MYHIADNFIDPQIENIIHWLCFYEESAHVSVHKGNVLIEVAYLNFVKY